MLVKVQPSPLADLRGGARDAPPPPPPPGSKLFHFHAAFGKNLKNNSNFGSWCIPLRKILDPPLITINELHYIYNSRFKDSHSHPTHTCFLIMIDVPFGRFWQNISLALPLEGHRRGSVVTTVTDCTVRIPQWRILGFSRFFPVVFVRTTERYSDR